MSDTTDPTTHVLDQTDGVADRLEDEPAGSARTAPEAGAVQRTAAAQDAAPAAGAASSDAPDDRSSARAVAVDGDEDRSGTAAADDAGPTAEVGAHDRDGTAVGDGARSGADDSIAHVFDQTNGVVEGLEGEADGTAEGDDDSAGDRGGLHEPNPVGQQDAWRDDHYGAEDGRDPNP